MQLVVRMTQIDKLIELPTEFPIRPQGRPGWKAAVTRSDGGTCCAQGATKEEARTNAICSATVTVMEDLQDGRLSVRDVFPLTLVDL